MGHNIRIADLTFEQIKEGSDIYRKNMPKRGIYEMTRSAIDRDWGNSREIGRKVGEFLQIWNKAFYEHGGLDFDKMGEAIEYNKEELDDFRSRSIITLEKADEEDIRKLFESFMETTAVIEIDDKVKSPVSVAKAQHVIAPNFFPLWDNKIADGWDCEISEEHPDEDYLKFMGLNKEIMEKFKEENITLKMIDECCFSIFTRDWYNP